MPKVLFLPDNVEVVVSDGENLLKAAMGGHVHLYAACGGAGTCAKCKVQVVDGEVKGGRSPKLSEQEREQGYVLACLSTISGDVSIRVPEESSLTHIKPPDEKRVTVLSANILSGRDFESRLPQATPSSAVRKLFVSIPPPSLDEPTADLERLERELAKHGIPAIEVDLRAIRDLPLLLRQAEWMVTATLLAPSAERRRHDLGRPPADAPYRLLRIEAGDTSARNIGMAVDIGTTTCAGELVDLNTGAVIAKASAYNQQIAHGDDVITRIVAAGRPGGRELMRDAVLETVNSIIADLEAKTASAGDPVKRDEIIYVTAAGNTTMTQLLLGIPPRYIREEPYVPTATFYPFLSAAEAGLSVSECAPLYMLPCIASYVGGDIVAGLLASGLTDREELTLFIDMGTNGEMVLGNKDWMMTCACSAGPAFEGGGIKHGMRAAKGAIELIRVDPRTKEPTTFTIGQTRPLGICGSGIINAISELYMAGLMEPDGSFVMTASKRMREVETGKEFLVTHAHDSGTGSDIVLTETDIDNLKRAKGAIFAGMTTLMAAVGLPLGSISEVLIAGGFGHYIDVEKAVNIGLLPELPAEDFAFVGNGSLLGSRLALISEEMRLKAEDIAAACTYLELSHIPSYMDHYMSALFFPHTDGALFPGVLQRHEASIADSE